MPRRIHGHVPDRPFMELEADELEALVRENISDRVVLARIREELQLRDRKRARQLLREVIALLEGEVEMPPKPPKEDRPENQLPLIG